MALRPDVIIRQVNGSPAAAPATSPMPVVFVGIQRQLEYQQLAGTYLGGQANSYDFPGLITGSAVEPASQADPFLRPRVYVSGDYGVAEVTADTSFSNLDQSIVAPSFVIATNAEATFQVATGAAGDYSSTSGAFTDPAADFIAGRVGAGDVIKLAGVPAFTVSALVSDDQLTVTRINHGPSNALAELGVADSQGARVLSYLGTLGAAYDGFITGGVRVGDAVSFDEWTERTATLGLSYTATASARRTITSNSTQFTSALIGDIVMIRDDANVLEPAFVLTANTGNSSRSAANIQGALADDDIAGSSGYPARYFITKRLTTLRGAKRFTGFFGAQNQSAQRVFTDVSGDFINGGVVANDWIVVYAADSTTITVSTVAANSLTRSTGSWITDGFVIGMKALILSATQSANKIEVTITNLTDTVMTVAETLSIVTSPDTMRIVSADVTPLFQVVSRTSATSLVVTDLATGVLPAASVGGPLMYSIYSVTSVSGGAASGANVSVEGTIQTSGKRFVSWPTGFTSGTLPLAGEAIYSDNGVRLFTVVSAVKVNATADVASFNFNSGTDRIVRASGSWVTAGFAVGDYIQVIGSSGAANDFTHKIAAFATTSVTNDTIVVEVANGATSTPPYTDGIQATNASDTTATVQKLVVADNADPGFDMAATDSISGGYLSVRQANAAPYEVVRVNSETEILVRSLVSSDVVTNTNILGLSVSITVPDTVTDEAYTIEKTLTGADLSGDVLVTYAARRTDHAGELVEIPPGSNSSLVGPSVPGNPIGFAAEKSVSTVSMYFAQLSADTDDGWADALALISTDQVYHIVPLTQDESRLAQVRTHVALLSQPEEKMERKVWQSHLFSRSVTRFTMNNTVDSAVVKYPSSVQTIEITHAGGLAALGVVVGDVIAATYLGYLPSRGYTTGTISARISAISEIGDAVTLTLVADTTLPTTLSTGVSLTALTITSRTYSTSALKTAIAGYPGTIASPRVVNIYPDRELVTFSDTTNPTDPTVGIYGGGTIESYEVGGWIEAAKWAAYRASLPVSTPFKGRTVSGTQRLISPFTRITDIDAIIDGGNMVLEQSGENAAVGCYRGITTDVSSLSALEEIVGNQVDSFVRKFRQQFKPLTGSTINDDSADDLFSINQQAVCKSAIDNKEIKDAKLLSYSADPDRPDTNRAAFRLSPYFTNAHLDVTVYY